MFLLDLWELYGKPSRQLGETPIISMWGFFNPTHNCFVLWYFRTRGSYFPVIADKRIVIVCNEQFPFWREGKNGVFHVF